ncbi:MAG TPA: UbiX family flavin prenyltransferase [Ramlibacter sp.]|uniref:UbiX family flavin prenyltransferase n=1 Tax=Ramlibacter sp. TaxID=1917967 RepID=UPI002C9947FB|nr:UbiX family flavin prenyltransferase [Ramlibacter sp.]HVZ44105.1 UbiX family flavin prenyltransferase [Ramlibacter sp.]
MNAPASHPERGDSARGAGVRPRIIVGITGASGAIYGIALLKALRELDIESHLIISQAASLTIHHETDFSVQDVKALADKVYAIGDIAASCSSGSFATLGMIIAPCSMKTLAEIATGVTSNLISRSADVVLKERRRLVLLARESPLTEIHIGNMLTVTRAGAIVAPPVPAFYNRPASIHDIVVHTVGRTLDLFGLSPDWVKRWG